MKTTFFASPILFCAALVLAGHSTNASARAGGCHDSEITGQSQRDPATGAFLGEGTIILGGHVNEVAWESVVTAVLPGADGSLALTTATFFQADPH